MRASRVFGAYVATTAILLLGAPSTARAHGDWYDQNYGLIGLTMGARFGSCTPAGFFFGVEGSYVHLGGSEWYGGYADLVYDFGKSATRFSIGPEAGYSIAGIDGGLELEFQDETGARVGFSLRPMLTLGLASFFTRFEHLLGSGDAIISSNELGLLLKYPVNNPLFW